MLLFRRLNENEGDARKRMLSAVNRGNRFHGNLWLGLYLENLRILYRVGYIGMYMYVMCLHHCWSGNWIGVSELK